MLEGSIPANPVSTSKLLRGPPYCQSSLLLPTLHPTAWHLAKVLRDPQSVCFSGSPSAPEVAAPGPPLPLSSLRLPKLCSWVSFLGLGRHSPAPRSSAHMHGKQMPPGERRPWSAGSALLWCHLLWGLPSWASFRRVSQTHMQQILY